jgi:ATP-dependent 26S proteasome regulatory subunit
MCFQVRFEDIVGNDLIKRALRRMLSSCQSECSERFERFGVSTPRAALLHGPPGNSKTRLVMAAATEFGLPLISLSCADVYSAYVGEQCSSRSDKFEVLM